MVAGRWTPGEQGAASVEEGLAKTLGLKLGDTLRFDMAGVLHEVRITSLRKVDWGSMRANFFVMFPVDHLDNVAVTYLAAYRAPTTAGLTTPWCASTPTSPTWTWRPRWRRCSAC